MVILMQSSKGEGLATALGGGSLTGAVFGGRGTATFLSKTTTVLAIAFMISCLLLTFVSPTRQVSVTESAVKKSMQQQLPGGQPTTLPLKVVSNRPVVKMSRCTGGQSTNPTGGN
jgi:preprotein translocase subunit SecG